MKTNTKLIIAFVVFYLIASGGEVILLNFFNPGFLGWNWEHFIIAGMGTIFYNVYLMLRRNY